MTATNSCQRVGAESVGSGRALQAVPNTISRTMPTIVKAISTHQPVRSISCSRRTLTAKSRQKSNNAGDGALTGCMSAVGKDGRIDDAGDDADEARQTRTQYQYSDRAARPENVDVLAKAGGDCIR